MKIVITFLIYLIHFTLIGQEPSRIDKFILETKLGELEHSFYYSDTIDLFNQRCLNNDYYLIEIDVGVQNVIFQIPKDKNDTCSMVISHVYQVKKFQPSKAERKKFLNFEIKEKEIFKLNYKRTILEKAVFDSLHFLLSAIDFESLPLFEDLLNKYKIVEADGSGLTLSIIENAKKTKVYYSSSIYLRISNELKKLYLIEKVTRNYIETHTDIFVAYKKGYCYNSMSPIWMCY